MKTIYLDILVNGYFYKQLPYRYSPIFAIDERDVKKYVLEQLPTLTRKNWTVGLSHNRISRK